MRQVGYTLVEIAIVVVILSLVAAALLQTSASVDTERTLDAASAEVAAALRFARSEAVRTGTPHGVITDVSAQRIRVYLLDEAVSPPVLEYTVRHPVDKKLHDLNFATDTLLEPVRVTSAVFWYSGVFFPQSLVGFNPDGTPKYNDSGTIAMLNSGSISLAAGSDTRMISIAPMTGRVTIQ